MAGPDNIAISARGIIVGFGDQVVLDGLDLDVRRGEIIGFVGPSGAGKSVLLRTIVGLQSRRAGTIEVLGKDIDAEDAGKRDRLERILGHSVSIRSVVQLAHRCAKHRGAAARTYEPVARNN